MKLEIDYLAYTEHVNIKNDLSDLKLWNGFYTFICDYIPPSAILYSERSISFAWRHFLAIKGHVGHYIMAHRDQISLKYTDEAKKMLLFAIDTSYSAALKREHRTVDEIERRLYEQGFIRSLTQNQLNNLEKISQLPGAATFSVPGAGKTTEALAFFFLNCTSSDKLLVVAPKNAFGAWDEQLDMCISNNQEQFVRLRGGEIHIQALLEKKPRFAIITYDQLPRVKNLIINFLTQNDVFMFLDESHRVKGGKQVKRAEAILELAHLPVRKLIMSGTPMPQSPKDMISQFLFLYPTKDIDEASVIETMQPLYVRTTKRQLGIPDVTHKVVTVDMPKLQREIYKSLKSEIRRQMNPMLSDSSRFELRRIGKCVMKVMEFVSNPSLLARDMDYVFDRRVGNLLLQVDGPKIDYVCKRARELALENKKVIIWSCFVQNVELIALRLSDLGAEYIHGGVDAGDDKDGDTREGKIKRFHDDINCKVLVANPAACSEGISLHRVCQYAIYLDRSFNAAHYLQSEDRIHRLGLAKEARPTIEFVECKDSIDQVIRERLTYKVNVMAQSLNDTSLRIEPDIYEDDEEEIDDIAGSLSSDDAKAVIDYFFGGVNDD